jgi:cation diffusion facilitator CzcD-associated flavoprotein CzcO
MPLRLLIIGGGAAGLACLQAVLETDEYGSGQWSVSSIEERGDIGGIWCVKMFDPLQHIGDICDIKVTGQSC